jgi:hypothetical protein
VHSGNEDGEDEPFPDPSLCIASRCGGIAGGENYIKLIIE